MLIPVCWSQGTLIQLPQNSQTHLKKNSIYIFCIVVSIKHKSTNPSQWFDRFYGKSTSRRKFDDNIANYSFDFRNPNPWMVLICWSIYGHGGWELHKRGKRMRCHGGCWHGTFLPTCLFASTKLSKLTGFTFHTDEFSIREWCQSQALQVKVFAALSLTRNQRVTRAFTDL